jgi:hypothetical protein
MFTGRLLRKGTATGIYRAMIAGRLLRKRASTDYQRK